MSFYLEILVFIQLDNMAGQKCGCSSAASDISSNDAGVKAKCQLTMHTFEKWQRELDCEHHILP